MAKLYFNIIDLNNPNKQRKEREYHGKDVSKFIRTLQEANNIEGDDGIRFVWRFDYGLCEYHKQQQYLAKLNSGKVYYIRSGRDCDGVEYAEALEYQNEWEAEQQQEQDYQWADGPMYFNPCTKAEYEEFTNSYRDTFAEAAGY